MPGPIVRNETTASELGDFVAILANLTRRAFGIDETPEYVVYQEHTSDAIHHLWATVHIYGRGTTSERPYRFTGRATSDKPQAIQLAAREAIVQLRHQSSSVNIRPFLYYPSRDGYGRPTQVTNREQESDPALVHLVCYLRAQEALFDQVTFDLIETRKTLALLTPTRSEAEPAIDTLKVLLGSSLQPPSSPSYPGQLRRRSTRRGLGIHKTRPARYQPGGLSQPELLSSPSGWLSFISKVAVVCRSTL